MELIDVTIRESVYLKRGMNEQKALIYLKKYIELMPFEEVQNVELCFLDNVSSGTLLYDEDFIRSAYQIVKGKYNLIAVIHPNLVDLDKWNPDVIKMFKTVRFMINSPIDAHAEKIMDYLHELGVEVSVNVIYISKKNERFVEDCVAIAHKHNAEYFCFADSCGNCLPGDVMRNVAHLQTIKGSMKLNYHLHDHFGLALANALTCYNDVNLLDCSAHGIGKGGGNLSLENIVLAGRKMEKKPIQKREIVQYAQLLNFLVADVLEEDWEPVREAFENLLIGVYNCNLKEAAAIEEKAGGDFLKYCEFACDMGGSK